MKLRRKKKKYYSLANILEKEAYYNIIIGERSNGKTYAALEYGLRAAIEKGEQMAIIRRWQEDFRGKRGASMFDALVANNLVSEISGGEWTGIYYFAGRWYLCRYNERGERVQSETPIAYAFAIATMEHDKSTSYPGITTVVFDEFLTRSHYIPDEFIHFMNVLSTIIRDRDNVKIFMLGNTVNKYCPYFSEMGLTHIKEMKPGTIDLYTYGESKLSVAVEFTDNPDKDGKASDLYFAFDNPRLNMITGKGQIWEIAIYPHLPHKYKPKDILFTFFVQFNGDTLQLEVIQIDDMRFVFVHRKSGEIKNPDRDLVYTPDYSPRPNYRRKITTPLSTVEKRIYELFKADKVFYQDNETGEIMRNYMLWCLNGAK